MIATYRLTTSKFLKMYRNPYLGRNENNHCEIIITEARMKAIASLHSVSHAFMKWYLTPEMDQS